MDMNFPLIRYTDSTEMTEALGRELAELMIKEQNLPGFVAMYGDLGVGKTSFVRGFCSEICRGYTVKSPTFALVNEYKCKLSENGIKRVYHFDMYRIADEDDLYSIGYYDYLRPDSICIAEWCEMIPFALPDEYLRVQIEKVDFGDKRKISVSLIGV